MASSASIICSMTSFDIAASEYAPKPKPESYDRLMRRHGFAGDKAVLFEDLARNLAPAHDLGFATVLVHSNKDWSQEPLEVRPAGRRRRKAAARPPRHRQSREFSARDRGRLTGSASPSSQRP
ncbi:MAG: HAD-IA family hydrolase [Alphaproteobacteria bacterium]